VVAELAPEDMRGRYMGFYGLIWGVSFGIGPLTGGLILSASNGAYRRVLWYAALVVGMLGAAAFLVLGRYLRKRAAKIKWQEMMARYNPVEPQEAPVEAATSGVPVIPGSKLS
jgi:MFS family permease